ncbi:MAG: GNAT family N-acetyltransferase [Planctomycetaceae bacterium]
MNYRPFQNTDPPRLLALWHAGGLGRGAAEGVTADVFEIAIFSRMYFDRQGLILACDGDQVVGFVHAGFGPNEDETALNRQTGVICAVLVHPSSRRRGIGRELVNRAETYLADAGATEVLAGAAPPNDPFYGGLYGGGQPAGFLDSDPDAVPFFTALGYETLSRRAILQRALTEGTDPVNVQLMAIRRKTQLAAVQGPLSRTWWWQARYGAADTLRFALVEKNTEQTLAAVTAVNLEFYLPKWGQQALGLFDLTISPECRNDGYGQALIVEVCRRLREERFTLVEVHVSEDDAGDAALYGAAGFTRIDGGSVLRKIQSG